MACQEKEPFRSFPTLGVFTRQITLSTIHSARQNMKLTCDCNFTNIYETLLKAYIPDKIQLMHNKLNTERKSPRIFEDRTTLAVARRGKKEAVVTRIISSSPLKHLQNNAPVEYAHASQDLSSCNTCRNVSSCYPFSRKPFSYKRDTSLVFPRSQYVVRIRTCRERRHRIRCNATFFGCSRRRVWRSGSSTESGDRRFDGDSGRVPLVLGGVERVERLGGREGSRSS